jgi:hypothetical protein
MDGGDEGAAALAYSIFLVTFVSLIDLFAGFPSNGVTLRLSKSGPFPTAMRVDN